MKYINLTQNQICIIDDEDFEKINQYKWYAWYNESNKKFYACNSIYKGKKNGKKTSYQMRMHRLILGIADPKIHVDHINGNGLDNRKENLRPCSLAENTKNKTKLHIKNTSGYRGVTKGQNTTDRIWKAQIQNRDGKRICIGYFLTAEEAAKAFDKAAIEFYGEFCGKLNFEKEVIK